MVRFLIFLLTRLTGQRPYQRELAWQAAGRGGRPDPPPRRRRIPPKVGWAAAILAGSLVFRRAIAASVLIAVTSALHLVGIDAHLPGIGFAWPWQTIGTAATRDTSVGPWVLQKIEGISRPALGTANFSFVFTHKVSKSVGPWPCWYASTFSAAGHASATVDLNPGPAWWRPGSGHYRLTVLRRPGGGRPGLASVAMVLPRPQLPRSVHDVTIDDIPSRPIDSQHSWTYPGLGCGVLLRPQFPESVLYAQAQRIAFVRATRVPRITGPLIAAAEASAVRIARDNLVQPTLNALGYRLDSFAIHWVAAASPRG